MKLGFIGDAHGKMAQLQSAVDSLADTSLIVQVGDLGLGFVDVPTFGNKFRFIRGNHDSPALAIARNDYFGDYGLIRLDDKTSMFYVSGADSPDASQRIIGVDWWPDEQLSIPAYDDAIEMFGVFRPDIVVSHDAPSSVYGMVAGYGLLKSRSNMALDAMLKGHQPRAWVFGHFHRSIAFVSGGTTFYCLDELETLTLDTEKL